MSQSDVVRVSLDRIAAGLTTLVALDAASERLRTGRELHAELERLRALLCEEDAPGQPVPR